jgi:hypothetical protein
MARRPPVASADTPSEPLPSWWTALVDDADPEATDDELEPDADA